MKADAMLEKGDIDGQAAWLRILRAVKELLLAQPDKKKYSQHDHLHVSYPPPCKAMVMPRSVESCASDLTDNGVTS